MPKESKENSLVVYDATKFQIMKSDIDVVGLINDNLGGENLTAWDLDIIKVPLGGGLSWSLPTISGDKEVKELTGIILLSQVQRTYWKQAFSGGSTPPDCFAEDAINGVGSPGGLCDECPLSKFGSSERSEKAQACQMKRLLFVLTENSILPMVVRIPATSLKNSKKYLLKLATEGDNTPVHHAVTTLSLIKKPNKDGLDYSEVQFKLSGVLGEDESIKVDNYLEQVKSSLTSAASDIGADKVNSGDKPS